MTIEQIAPRLWSWSAHHPEWKQEVFSYALVENGTLVLFDPLVPEPLWEALDADVHHHGPPAILITVQFHVRSSRDVLDRYEGATLWAHDPALSKVRRRVSEAQGFEEGDSLPGGVEPLAMHHMDEAAFWLPAHKALVLGDSVIRSNGHAELCPPKWLRKRETVAEQRASVERAVARNPQSLLLTHGGPISARDLRL